MFLHICIQEEVRIYFYSDVCGENFEIYTVLVTFPV